MLLYTVVEWITKPNLKIWNLARKGKMKGKSGKGRKMEKKFVVWEKRHWHDNFFGFPKWKYSVKALGFWSHNEKEEGQKQKEAWNCGWWKEDKESSSNKRSMEWKKNKRTPMKIVSEIVKIPTLPLHCHCTINSMHRATPYSFQNLF